MSVIPFFLAGHPTTRPRTAPIHAPWDGQLLAEVCVATPEDLDHALHAAWAARPTLAGMPRHRRAAILEAARDAILSDLPALAATLSAEAGKPVTLAEGEVRRTADTFTDAAFAARGLAGTPVPLDAAPGGEGRVALSERVPVGVLAAITPFNFPLNLVAHKLAPAIAAGCPVVLKPAPETPLSALRLAQILYDAGLPPEALSVLPLDVSDAGPLSTDPRVAALSFTGSAAVGWKLKAQAQRARVFLELGGNAGVYVHSDADLDLAASRIAWGGFAYAGQACISVQRVFVHAEVYDAFVPKLLREVSEQITAGDPASRDTVVGPLIRRRDADRVRQWVREAVQAGATRLLGTDGEGQLVPPQILCDAPSSARVCREEVFGPVVVLQRVGSAQEALGAINDSPFGLQAGVFTEDVSLLLRAHRELEVGAVIHNDASTFRVDLMPYGGVKQSGLGREGPRYVVEELTEPRLLVLRMPT